MVARSPPDSRLPKVVAVVCTAAIGFGATDIAPARSPDLRPPLEWPSSVTAASTGQWLIGVDPTVPLPAAVRRAGAETVRPGTIAVPVADARRVGRALKRRGLLRYAEPDVEQQRSSTYEADPGAWARGAIVRPGLHWPAGGPAIGVVDDFVDGTHPDLAGKVSHVNASASSRIEGPHGTLVASAAAAAADGTGVIGVMPTAGIVSYGVPAVFGCSESTRGIDALSAAGVRIINLSYGSQEFCFTEYLAVQQAFGGGALVVASAGNEYVEGNAVSYPAAFPHVLSVAALDRDLNSAYFSTANAAVDLAAPGVGVPLAIPPAFDTDDGGVDGFTEVDGTSFSAPMVAGAASWVWSARPELSVGQVGDVLRRSALDLEGDGWDVHTGWGLVNIEAALKHPRPFEDHSEPNDDMGFVNGTFFSEPDAYIWRGRGRRRLRAFADFVEDPVDVYRFRMRGRSRARVKLEPVYGDVDLEVYRGGARYVGHRSRRVCTSARYGRRIDSCDLVLRGRRARSAYVVVRVPPTARSLESGYTLRLQRVRYRR